MKFHGSRSRIKLEKFLANLIVNGSVLDIGGAQRPVNKRVSQKSKISTYHILDLEVPHELKSKIDFRIDIESKKFNSNVLEKYDYIFCLEVSLYWSDPQQAIRNIAAILNDSTILIINFHQYLVNQKPDGLDNIRYSKYSIDKYLNENNLKIIDEYPTKLSKLSYLILRIFWHREKMRINKDYEHSNISNFLYLVCKRDMKIIK